MISNPAASNDTVAFYSEQDDLSDITECEVSVPGVLAGATTTLLNIVSGGCRFLGGYAQSEVVSGAVYCDIEITVDGGAMQSFTLEEEGGMVGALIPPIKADNTLLIQFRNTHGSNAIDMQGHGWYRT